VRTPLLDLARPGVHALCRAYFGLDLVGVENIPRDGAVIITPNHQTYADPPMVTIPVRRPVYYMAWSRLFEIPGLSWAIRRLRAFPVRLESQDPRAAREAVRLLEAGEALMIFPEGGRSRDGSVQPFKPGAFRLAVALGVPILPVTIDGATRAWPPGQILPRPGAIRITYHALIRRDPALEPRQAVPELARQVRGVITGALQPVSCPPACPTEPGCAD
jgi:1-acyl-sn-glycerol-3-phosphate acyltransferase